jgi:hypothetical protein
MMGERVPGHPGTRRRRGKNGTQTKRGEGKNAGGDLTYPSPVKGKGAFTSE